MLSTGIYNQTVSTMADYTRQLNRIIELLEEGREDIPNTAPPSDRPVHSGHKGSSFISEAREGFNHRFADTDLTWKAVNGWITMLYSLSGKARKEAPDASAEDVLWLYQTLRASLDNGFAQILAE